MSRFTAGTRLIGNGGVVGGNEESTVLYAWIISRNWETRPVRDDDPSDNIINNVMEDLRVSLGLEGHP